MRYIVSGGLGGLIQLAVDYLFVDVLGRWYMEGVIVGFLTALIVVFLLHKYWTFKDYDLKGSVRQFGIYSTVSVCALFGNVFFMALFVSVLNIWYIWAQLATICIVSGASFFVNTFVTFKR